MNTTAVSLIGFAAWFVLLTCAVAFFRVVVPDHLGFGRLMALPLPLRLFGTPGVGELRIRACLPASTGAIGAIASKELGLTTLPNQRSEGPAMSMYNTSIPIFEIGFNALSAILDKAEAYAEAKRIDPTVLLTARLFPDMFAFTRQVQSACDQAKNGGARLAGIDPPKYEDNEKTIAELKARIAKTVAFVKTLDARKIDASADREITLPLGPNNKGHMKGADYLNHFALPNFYFHLTTAYDILRHCGVEIGKRDFLGAIPMRMT
jgi:hypothetical protein